MMVSLNVRAALRQTHSPASVTDAQKSPVDPMVKRGLVETTEGAKFVAGCLCDLHAEVKKQVDFDLI
jgi:hypothetical protein